MLREHVRHTLRSGLWMLIYLAFVLAPLFALLLGEMPAPRDRATEFAAALGYAGLAMMGLQFGLTARFRKVTEPWGEDVIYHFHRQLSLVAVGLVLTHAALLIATRPELRRLPDPAETGWGAAFAVLAVVALMALVVMALGRARLGLRYELWHVSHVVLAVTAVFAGLVHMVGWGFYLEDPWKRALWIGLTLFWVGLLVHVRLVRPLFRLRRPFRVAEVRAERGDCTTLAMVPDGHAGFRFAPGQFGWLTVWGSPFGITANPFSFSSSAEAPGGRVEMTIRRLGDFTARVPDIPVGQRVWLDGPYGAFTLDRPQADMLVMIAGGIGITPMMSILRTQADRGDRRPMVLLYACRDAEAVTFREELEALARQPDRRLDLRLVLVLGNPPPGWTGETGPIDAALLGRHVPLPHAEHEYFICGPGPMMDAVETALAGLGVPRSRYHSERYSFA